MIYYYNCREITEILKINQARWKRWSRAFLPPDPLGGFQSGFARQYAYKDIFKVFLGGHLLSHHKLSVPESQQVLGDLTSWLKKSGYYDLKTNGGRKMEADQRGAVGVTRLFFRRLPTGSGKTGYAFQYLVQRILMAAACPDAASHQMVLTIEETGLQNETAETDAFYRCPEIYLVNISALSDQLIEQLRR